MRGGKNSRSPYSTEYLESLDSIDAQILTELASLDPRNISDLARAVKRPIETVRYRYNRMARILNLKLTSYVVYSKLGLKRVSVFCFLTPKNVKTVGKALENLDYWTYLARFYGVTEGYYCVYALPAEQSDFLVKYLATMSQAGLIRHFVVHATGDPHVLATNFRGLDFRDHTWRFEWSKWLGELERDSAQTATGLADPQDFSPSADKICIRVLERIEDNSSTSFVEIANEIGLTPQDIRYHYFRHIMGRGIVSGFRPTILPFPRNVANHYTMFLKFHNTQSMVNFADWLSTTFLAMNYAKVIGENSLIAHTYMPTVEENNMHNFLFQMSETGYLDDYYYVPIDVQTFKGWSVRPEKFDVDTWQLNQETYLHGLREIIEQSSPSPKPQLAAGQMTSAPQTAER